MSRSASSGSGSGASYSPAGSATNQATYPNSCTFVKQKDTSSSYGCYLYRSCQSCLQTQGCVVNDLGICVNADQGLFNLEFGRYQPSTNYYPAMNYLKGINQSLALPVAASTNAAALTAEQNWHFRAGEATYCSASDATCQECKQKNFWRGNDTSVLPDSRFCVGQNGCVCIQTCEVPAYKPQGCKWKLSSASSFSSYYSGYDYYNYYPKERLAWWNWLIIIAVIVFVHWMFRRCQRAATHEETIKQAREEAVKAVRRELGVITGDEPRLPTAVQATRQQPVRSQTMMSESDYEESFKDEDTAVADSHVNFMGVVDEVPVQSTRTPQGNR